MEYKKHAYLIMAHNEPELLIKLIKCLDDNRNDLYVHLDKRFDAIDQDYLQSIPKFSNIYFLERKPIYWSGYSQIDCELRLLKESIPLKYGYYHFISGVDLPIKSQDYIHKFFEENDGKEFIDVTKVKTWKITTRYKYYHFEKINNLLSRKWSRSLRFVSSIVQAALLINKVKCNNVKDYYWGSAWFSITHDFAEFLVQEEPNIYKVYNHGYFNDEVFLATLLMNSRFGKNLSEMGYVRLIDWRRGNPYIWTSNEYDEIVTSDALFCRKFSMQKDAKIIEKILDFIH